MKSTSQAGLRASRFKGLAFACLLATIVHPAPAPASAPSGPDWTYIDLRFTLGGALLVLPETKFNGTHTMQFVSSLSHAEGTPTRVGTTVHNCHKPVGGQVVVNGHVGKPPITVIVSVGTQPFVPVHWFAAGPVSYPIPLSGLSLSLGQPIKVVMRHGHESTGWIERAFYLLLKCQPLQPPELGSVATGTAAVAAPVATPAKPLAPVPAQAAPQQPSSGPVLPPSNVKFAMDCQLKGINAPVGDAYQPIAEVRPKMPWVNPPATARIGVTVINAPPNYPASTFQYFKLPQSLWQQGGPHARVTLPSIKVLNVLVSRAGKQGTAPFALATCTATADPAPDSIAGYPLTP